MKRINNTEYFKILKNQQSNTILISIGEEHSREKCEADTTYKTYDVNNFIGDVFGFYKQYKNIYKSSYVKYIENNINTDVCLLLEIQTASPQSSIPIESYAFEPTRKLGSKLFNTCEKILKHKKWKWIPIDPRGWSWFSPLMFLYVKIILENSYNYIELVRYNIKMLTDNVTEYLNEDTSYFSNEIRSLLIALNTVMSNRPSRASIENLILKIWINVQDLWCQNEIQAGKINIIYTGHNHNENMEKFFTDHGFDIEYEGVKLKKNCTLVDTSRINEILKNYYTIKINSIDHIGVDFIKAGPHGVDFIKAGPHGVDFIKAGPHGVDIGSTSTLRPFQGHNVQLLQGHPQLPLNPRKINPVKPNKKKEKHSPGSKYCIKFPTRKKCTGVMH